MEKGLGLDQPAIYQIRVQGALHTDWQDWLDGFQISTKDGETTLCGFVVDQPALFGLLIKIRNLGLTVLSVERLDSEAAIGPDESVSSLPEE